MSAFQRAGDDLNAVSEEHGSSVPLWRRFNLDEEEAKEWAVDRAVPAVLHSINAGGEVEDWLAGFYLSGVLLGLSLATQCDTSQPR